MPQQHAKFFEILVRQIAKNRKIDGVLGKALGVLPKADVLKPVRNLLHRARRSLG